MAGEVFLDPLYPNRADRALAAVAALRADPRNLAMNQDATANVRFVSDTQKKDRMGQFDPATNEVEVYSGAPAMRQTLYHELLHSLQYAKGGSMERPAASNDPLSLPATHEGTPQQFTDAARKAGLYHENNPREVASHIGMALTQPEPMNARERQVIAQFPGMAGMYAAQTSQPNRPAPKHMKGYPEMSWLNQKAYDLTGHTLTNEDVTPEAKYSVMQQQVLRRLNEETNPRDRR